MSATPPPRDSPPTPPSFTASQVEELQRLWKTHFRHKLGSSSTSSTSYETSASSRTTSSKKKQGDADGPTTLTIQHMTRLHAYMVALLEKAMAGDHSRATATHAWLVSDIRQSCLEGYTKPVVALPKRRQSRSISNSNENDNSSIRLRGGRRVLSVDYNAFMSELNRFEFQGDASMDVLRSHSFGAFLYHFPLQALPAANVSMSLAIATLYKKQYVASSNQGRLHPDRMAQIQRHLDRFLDLSSWQLRFLHVTPSLPMADVKTGLVRKFISIKGNVVKSRPKRLRVAMADFTCQKCASLVHSWPLDQGRYSTPTKCSNPTCKGRTFVLSRPTARYTNVQELRLQEAQDESTSHAGRTPRQLDVFLQDDDLMDSSACRPGDTIMLACYVDAVNTAVAAGRTGKQAQQTSTYKLFLQGHSITTLSETTGGGGANTNNKRTSKHNSQQKVVYTQQQLQNITQLCHADHRCLSLVERRAFPFDLLVRSLCPSIIGHHSVKAGILLCLLGGTPPAQANTGAHAITIRSNSHILIVGDPGMGKSQMLNAATQLAARSVYVGGNTASTTGLTVTLTKEEGGETGIEAGALVLADQGVACIDELDKCKHLDGLLEAMEQQQVSIAKAGVVASLPARCSVIAAANPKHGSYNMSKTVAENLNMARPILSRFDLVFILRDRVDKDQDRLVSSNIMNLYRSKQQRNNNSSSTEAQQSLMNLPKDGNERLAMDKRLAWVSGFNEALPAGLVRDYIAYAREFCKPKLTPEAAEILKEYYMDLRYPTDGRRRSDTVPITTRQLEALIRLSQARAKACLREFVLKEDALDVVELLKRSVEQVHTDEYGIVDRTRGGAGGKSNRKMRKKFTEELYSLIGMGAECGLDDLRRVADRVACSLSEFQTMIEDMRNTGVLMKKANGRYKVVS